ncbi:MAG: cysteine synthase [Rhodovulum sulfidophilum]|uniref:L-cysteine desulfhydrase Cds1 n=1 Tax=Rhodovulum sulfidophilum TaxID=35806 RepID=A0A2W5N9P1_RHOSU|nr:MAG: cysteine synthase [Rhodovulum sulfidophilum]
MTPIAPARVPAACPEAPDTREWARGAIARLEGDARRSADTHLLNPSFPALGAVKIYLKDESTHPTGSLKHRLARSLIQHAICDGQIGARTTLVEASSGSTAVSEAYFAQLLNLPFIAVMPRATSGRKIAEIERFGGRCHFVDHPAAVYDAARRIAQETGGHYLDQFTNAERATDWRSGDNIAASIFAQMAPEAPDWIVMSAGTGGTSATIGRHIRYRDMPTRLCVVDVENSAFYECYRTGDRTVTCARGSRIEGIGRPRVEPSFIPGVIDHMIRVPDAASIAAARVLSARIHRGVGGSTGANFFGLCLIAAGMVAAERPGSLVTLICDGGERYLDTYFDDDWLAARKIDIAPHVDALNDFLDTGRAAFPAGPRAIPV